MYPFTCNVSLWNNIFLPPIMYPDTLVSPLRECVYLLYSPLKVSSTVYSTKDSSSSGWLPPRPPHLFQSRPPLRRLNYVTIPEERSRGRRVRITRFYASTSTYLPFSPTYYFQIFVLTYVLTHLLILGVTITGSTRLYSIYNRVH